MKDDVRPLDIAEAVRRGLFLRWMHSGPVKEKDVSALQNRGIFLLIILWHETSACDTNFASSRGYLSELTSTN
jgi:hypothetical protein